MILLVSFVIIFAISAYSAKVASVFPAVNCESIENTFGSKLQVQAVKDYDLLISHPEGTQSDGTLDCFCQAEQVSNPDTFKEESYGQSDGDHICEFYSDKVLKVYFLTTSLSYLLIGFNIILRTVCINLIDWIGYDSETVRLSKTTSVTFFVQIFNSGLLVLLINANLSQ